MCSFFLILLLLYISSLKHIYIKIKNLSQLNFEVNKKISTISSLNNQFSCQFLPSFLQQTLIEGVPRTLCLVWEIKGTISLYLYHQECRARAGRPWPPGHFQSTIFLYKNFSGTQPHSFVYMLSVSVFSQRWQRWVVATEAIWPTKSENLLFGLLQKVC